MILARPAALLLMPPFMADDVIRQHVSPTSHHPSTETERQRRTSLRSHSKHAFVVFRGERCNAGNVKIGIVYRRSRLT